MVGLQDVLSKDLVGADIRPLLLDNYHAGWAESLPTGGARGVNEGTPRGDVAGGGDG